ncbi:hypothetical protein RvY_15552-2 [Ramazzottius varieornatus]|uniref:Uncharacterized protein n=1 Tax=Ramazzottius varieornatus TaxID=947166 RepID=A0A1D1VYJ4_RAMVA|nr:hypothetical protein RvY_15552-2 [Ramazzottius varieornatus]
MVSAIYRLPLIISLLAVGFYCVFLARQPWILRTVARRIRNLTLSELFAGKQTLGRMWSEPPDPMRTKYAEQLMQNFASRTGISSTDKEPTRYLWTDSFAVCNFLALNQPEQALATIDSVHRTLTRERSFNKFLGTASEDHPTLGGLRIGKKLNERQVNEHFDERLEWDRDGQYFHYLTKWMFALDQVAGKLDKPVLNVWARELAEVAHSKFVYSRSGMEKRMYWKMSVDLSRPLVASQGHHDPLDGMITAMQLQNSAEQLGVDKEGPMLENVVADYQSMIQRGDFATADPLGLGGLLLDAYRVFRLRICGREVISSSGTDARIATCKVLLEKLLQASLTGVKMFAEDFDAKEPAGRRLAFREIGLSRGLRVISSIRFSEEASGDGEKTSIEALIQLRTFDYLREEIESFWMNEKHQQSGTYKEHQDINDVMLATTLIPRGLLN